MRREKKINIFCRGGFKTLPYGARYRARLSHFLKHLHDLPILHKYGNKVPSEEGNLCSDAILISGLIVVAICRCCESE